MSSPATTLPCPGCGALEGGDTILRGRDRFHGAPGEFAVIACAACGLAFTSPRLRDEDFAVFYPSTYTSYGRGSGSRRGLKAVVGRIRLELVARRGAYRDVFALPPGRLLDVGCGRGDLAAPFHRRGWKVSGVEPSAQAAAEARSQGVDVHVGTLDDAPWEDGAFDAVIFNHSLEHVPDPARALSRAAGLVREGGVVAVAVPNFASWQRRVFGTHWFQLDLPRHLQHFDGTTLAELMARSGLRPFSVETPSMRPGLLSSVQYRLFGRRRFAGRAFRIAVWLTSPLLKLGDLVAEGDCVHVVAERRAAPVAAAGEPAEWRVCEPVRA